MKQASKSCKCDKEYIAMLYSRKFELRSSRKRKERAIARLQKEIAEIDRALEKLQKNPQEP